MIAILVFSACGSDSTTDVTATDTPSATYAYISQKILARSCTECHGTKGGVTLSTFEGVQKVVTAKDHDKSLLYTVIEAMRCRKRAIRSPNQKALVIGSTGPQTVSHYLRLAKVRFSFRQG